MGRKEGGSLFHQSFSTQNDKLLNYIRFWMAEGESIKTSIRTKTRLGQIVKEGHFRGGQTPYGYRLEKQGRVNPRGTEVHEILIDEAEAAIVARIFELSGQYGYGSRKIASILKEEGIRNRKGNVWTIPPLTVWLPCETTWPHWRRSGSGWNSSSGR